MNRADLNFKLLRRLSRLVSSIDDEKTRMPGLLPRLVELAQEALTEMRMELMNIGTLDIYINAIEAAIVHRPETLPTFISAAHFEIQRLLGDRMGEVYADDEDVTEEVPA